MQQTPADLLPDELFTGSRKGLIPVWIKIFSWIFLVIGTLAFTAPVAGLMGYNFATSLYGLESNEPLSVMGLCLTVLFVFKGIVSVGILKQTDWAIKAGLADAITGIVICCGVTLYTFISPDASWGGSIRLELIALIPYLLKLKKIKPDWERIVAT